MDVTRRRRSTASTIRRGLSSLLAATCFALAGGIAHAQHTVGCATDPAARAPELVDAVASALAVGGQRTITLAAGCVYTFHQPAADGVALPVIGGTPHLITIEGNGAVIERAPDAPPFRLFRVNGNQELRLLDVTLRGGRAPDGTLPFDASGGAILSTGFIRLEGAVLTGNRAGAGGHGGALSVSTIGSATIIESALTDNHAGDGDPGGSGGAIYVQGAGLSLDRTTIARNRAGAGVTGAAGGDGGGLFIAADAGAAVRQSTFHANLAGFGGGATGGADAGAGGSGGGIAALGEVHVENSTFTANEGGQGGSAIGGGVSGFGGTGGAIWVPVGGDLTLASTTVAYNSGGFSGSGVPRVGGAVSLDPGSHGATRNSLFIGGPSFTVRTPNQACAGSLIDEGGNQQLRTGCAGSTANDRLGPLADNGGPTQTMALLTGSSAIDAADQATCPDVDQRGVGRPPGRCDVGAFERVAPRGPVLDPIRRGTGRLPLVRRR